MNKTLLLILCDFLLLTILSMWKTETDAPVTDDADLGNSDVNVSTMAMMEQDLLDTLSFSLEEEQAQREELNENLESKAEELAQREQELQERMQRIQNLEQNLSQAEQERSQLEDRTEALEGEVATARTEYTALSRQLTEAEKLALENQSQSEMLQKELQQKLSEIESKEAELSRRSQELASAQQQVQELGVQVRMKEQENLYLQDSVSNLKGEVVAEREERQRMQEQAGVLAQGVSELAASSQDLRQELRSNFEINANQLFSDFRSNQIEARFTAVKLYRNRYVQSEETASTILVTDGTQYYALAHIESLPFGLKTNPSTVRSLEMSLNRSGSQVKIEDLQFLALDPRIVSISLTPEEAKRLGGKPYLTALEPFKFPEAVLVNRQGDYYGEVEFKLDSSTPGFVKMQNKIFSSIFGEFSPSTGDLVLSKTGELLGVMVNRRYCALINNFVPAASLNLSGQLNTGRLDTTLERLNDTIDEFPSPLR